VHNVFPRGASDEAKTLLLIEPKGFDTAMYDELTATMEAHQGSGENHPSAFHAVGVKDDGDLVVVDVWPSEQAFAEFARENLADAAAKLGELEPRFVPVYKRLAPVGAPA